MKTVEGKTRKGQIKEKSLYEVAKTPTFMRRFDTTYDSFDPALTFLCQNEMAPSHRTITNLIPDESVIDKFIDQFGISESNIFLDYRYDPKEKKFKKTRGLVQVRQNLMVGFDLKTPHTGATVYFTHETIRQLVEDVSDFFVRFHDKTSSSKIGLLLMDPHTGLYIKDFDITPPDLDLSLCYNDDFPPVHETIMKKLNASKSKGIVLLHGQPGTGKTTYLRYLSSLVEKRIIFIPPDLANQVASPEFLSMMVEYPDSILVIEDAENVIRDRMSEENLSVSNLLNISDGLLSDCLNLQIIITFNTDISRIDKALLRKGRIIAKYEFKPLMIQKAEMIAESIGKPTSFNREMTLAEVYHQGGAEVEVNQNRGIGFRAA